MLPGNSTRALQLFKIIPGAIVLAYCPYIASPKYKYFFIAHVDIDDDLVLGFFINSRIHPLIQRNPDLTACQIFLPKKKYQDFLAHDSYLDCSKVQEQFGCVGLADDLANNPRNHKGMLEEDELIEVLQAVNGARTISNNDKNLIMVSLGE